MVSRTINWKIFSIKKKCVRLRFGKEVSYDRPEFYLTCARIRNYNQHTEYKSYSLEHTKPLFNEHKMFYLENLYNDQTFMDIFQHSQIQHSMFFEADIYYLILYTRHQKLSLK